ncbi:MAG: glycosyl transferase, partial [Bacteroidota bacterium]
RDKDCYLTTYHYKSYAHYYYQRRTEPSFPKEKGFDWLLNGPIDKDVYIVSRIADAKDLIQKPTLEKIAEKNGFVFFRRPKPRR